MSLTLGIDTFITLEDADEYFAGHLEDVTWAGYDTPKREAALRGSFVRIVGACEYTFDSIAAPEIVKIAQCEWALELTKQARKSTVKLTQLTEMQAGPAKMKFDHKEDDGYGGVNDWIKQMLSKDCQCSFEPEAETSTGGENSFVVINY